MGNWMTINSSKDRLLPFGTLLSTEGDILSKEHNYYVVYNIYGIFPTLRTNCGQVGTSLILVKHEDCR